MARKTIDRQTLVDTANEFILHLSKSDTEADRNKRLAISALTSSTLLAANSYKGFQYLNPPVAGLYDDSRIAFN